jgi:hypothetical protein
VVSGGYFAVEHWPYRYNNVEPLLQGVFSSKVTINHFRRTYLPHPGFVADGIVLHRNSAPDLPPVGSARELMIQSHWLDMLMLRREISLVRVTGMHIVIPPVGSRANHEDFPPGASKDFTGPSTVVDEFQIRDSQLDIMRTNGQRYSFPIHNIVMRHLLRGHPVAFSVDMRSAELVGRIQAQGTFGPLQPDNLGGTHLSGSFTFSHADLHGIGTLRGMLSAKGHFSGALDAVRGDATAQVQDFAVSEGEPVPITGAAQVTVNGLNGDLILNSITARTNDTLLHAEGRIVGSPAATDVDLLVTQGRAQDLLKPFLHAPVPIAGDVWVKAHAHVEPAEHGEGFLRRLRMDGGFNVPTDMVTVPSAEKTLSAFSDRAQKPSPPVRNANDDSSATDVVSAVQGYANITNGVISTRHLTFDIPGATTDLRGTFDLHTTDVHLLGKLRMQRNISHAVTGFKSILLKPLIPFFRGHKAGAVIPIAVTGTSGHYKVSQDIFHDK